MKSLKPAIKTEVMFLPTQPGVIQYRATCMTPWGAVDSAVWLDERKITKKQGKDFEKRAERSLFRYLEEMIRKRRKQRRMKP